MTVSMDKSANGAADVPPPPPSGALKKRSRSAVARSAGGDRSLLVLLGLVLLAGGVLVALLGYGVFGADRAGRPLLDPAIVDLIRAQPLAARIIAIVAGVLLLVLGLSWAAGSVRPERKPDLVIDRGPATAITVDAAAAADALAAQAAALPGVGRAKARMVGTEDAPAVRVWVWLTDDADARDVLERLHGQVLGAARTSLGIAALPVAVRLELDQASSGPRVA
ncbi:alkaline shock response membrane anchor protein AmaP [Pseudonocardia oceani]|uniref:alkaline shock response membrane anchor protein AmaP n=1 Tax=Pseudonocardia oceani TaxID=2792013 RepID=UPI001CEDDD14|nr:alkaline shock response membrane anchor protein AmaP [Pseudonocardia oceani]